MSGTARSRSLFGVTTDDQLVALSFTNEQEQDIHRRDRQVAMDVLARFLHHALAAESSALFVVSEDDPSVLDLEAAFSDKDGNHRPTVKVAIKSEAGAGLTGHTAAFGKPMRLSFEEIVDSPYRRRLTSEHLKSANCYSLLTVPLKDRHDCLLGLIKLENKKGPDGAPSERFSFSAQDLAAVELHGIEVVQVLDRLRGSDAARQIVQKLMSVATLDDTLGFLLHRLKTLLRADRADLTLLDEEDGSLRLRYQIGDGTVAVGEVVPTRGMVHDVWTNGTSALSNDVKSDTNRDYFTCDFRTTSEIAVRFEWQNRRLGVINLESFEPNWFSSEDLRLLEVFREYAGIAYWTREGRQLQQISMETVVNRGGPTQTFLEELLEVGRQAHGLDGGIFYVADYKKQRLWCEAFISNRRTEILLKQPRDFSYHFSHKSLATRIFHSGRGRYIPHPLKDEDVNENGLETFKIQGPIVGVPLVFGKTIVGVLVQWSDDPLKQPTEKHISALEPFAKVAAAAIVMGASELAIASSAQERERSAAANTIQRLEQGRLIPAWAIFGGSTIAAALGSVTRIPVVLSFIVFGFAVAGFLWWRVDRARALSAYNVSSLPET